MLRRARRHSAVVAAVITMMAAAPLTGCGTDDGDVAIPGADPARAGAVVREYGCGSCHTIPGIAGADGTAAPSLARFSQRGVIAGTLQFTPENLVSWIRDPQGHEPGVAMPDMHVTQQDAEDIAAYLLRLGG